MDTKEMFERKGFDSKAIEFLNNFLQEFNELYGKYLSQEEVIQRINDYLDEIEFVDEMPYSKDGKDDIIGCYSHGEKKVYIKKSDNDSEKAVFFHEMIHVLHRKITDEIEAEDEEKWLSEETLTMYLKGVGNIEGFTEYLTSKRDEKFSKGKTPNSYPVLTKQFAFLVNIVGEEDLIHGMFNSQEKVEETIQKSLDWDEDDCTEYCASMDIILEHEKEVFRSIAGGKSSSERLIDAIFGKNVYSKYPTNVESAINIIVKKYMKQKINDIDDFHQLMENVKLYADSLGKKVDEEMMMYLYQQYKKHPEFNFIENSPELYEIFKIYERLQEFYDLSFEEKLQFLSEENELTKMMNQQENPYCFKKMIVKHILKNDKDEFRLNRFVRKDYQLSDYNALYVMLTTGFLKELFQSGDMRPEYMAIEWIQSDDCTGELSLLNLFNANGINDKYLGTYLITDSDEITQYEIASFDPEERREQVSNICQSIYGREITDEDLSKYLFLRNTKSNTIDYACSIENHWMFIDEDEVTNLYSKPEYISSILETKVRKTKKFIDMVCNDTLLLGYMNSVGIIPELSMEDYTNKKQYISQEDIELEIDRQKISIGDIMQRIQEIGERLDIKESGNTLLINGGEDIEK